MKWKIKDVEISNQIVFAPMAGVSNISYRQIIKEMGAGLIYSEMISTLGIKYNGKKTIDLINFEESERPISIQIFGSDIDSFVEAAKYIEKEFHPDIIDINMGCPVPKVAVKSQAGSALLKNPDKIAEIIRAIKKEINTPLTIKIRSGWDDKSINAVEVAKKAEEAGIDAIAIHIGNGDVVSGEDAKRMLEYTGCDAVMIGRATLGNPWIIKEAVEYLETGKAPNKPGAMDKINMIKRHYSLLKKYTNEKSALLEIRTHALWYLKGIEGVKEYKNKLVQTKTEEEFMSVIDEIIDKIK